MKNRGLSLTTNLLSLVALFVLCSSFTYLANNPAATAETHPSFWSTLQGFSFEKLSFWQKTGLFLGATSVSYAVVNRQYHRHYGEGVGCLGVLGIILLGIILLGIIILGIIVLGAIIIDLLPVLLIVGLFMLILGISFPRFGSRSRRHRHYRRERF